MNDNYAAFCSLKRAEKTKGQIIEITGISARSYRRFEKRFADGMCSKHIADLTPSKYYDQIKRGFGTKLELAERFGTTKPTLNKYEQAWDAHSRISRGMYVIGRRHDARGIASALHLSRAETEAKKYINGIPNLNGIVKNLNIVIGILAEFAEFDTDLIEKVSILKDAKSKIEACTEREVIGINLATIYDILEER